MRSSPPSGIDAIKVIDAVGRFYFGEHRTHFDGMGRVCAFDLAWRGIRPLNTARPRGRNAAFGGIRYAISPTCFEPTRQVQRRIWHHETRRARGGHRAAWHRPKALRPSVDGGDRGVSGA